MINVSAKVILLDVEGTTSSIAFVYEKMFPYARAHVREYCETNWGQPELEHVVELLALDAGYLRSSRAWFDSRTDQPQVETVIQFATKLMDADSKATGLKALQGLLWKSGFESGELQSHLFTDVPPAIKAWHQAGLRIAIYSSGSVTAQRLFFGYTIFGDLNPYLCGNFDTTLGSKHESASYRKIAAELRTQCADVLFLSDVVGEIEAATLAGMQSIAVVRPGNQPLTSAYSGRKMANFDDLKIS